MAAPITPTLSIEQKVSTVTNNDISINAEITTQNAAGWLVSLMLVSGANMVLLFSRTIPNT